MNWPEVRSIYPNRWVLLESVESHHEKDKWYPDQVAIIDQFSDVVSALTMRKNLRNQLPKRDLFIAHTSNAALNIQERHWIGVGFIA